MNLMSCRFALLARLAAATVLLLAGLSCRENEKTPAAGSGDTPVASSMPRTAYPMPPAQAAAPSVEHSYFTLLDNRRATLADYRGRALVVDFWATYCPPCREEIPELLDLQRRYGSQGLQVIGLNVGGEEDRDLVPGFVKTYRISYPLGYPDQSLTDLLMGEDDSIPQTLVFDRQGRLVEHFTGYESDMAGDLEAAVRTALASTAG